MIPYDAEDRRSAFHRVSVALGAALRWRRRLDVIVSFQPFARLEHFALLRCLRPRILIGFNKDVYRLFDYSLEEHRQGVDLMPVAARARSVMRVFGLEVDPETLRPHVPFGPADEALAQEALSGLSVPGPRLLLNAYGAAASKRLSPMSVRRIVEAARGSGHRGPIYVSVPRGKAGDYEAALGEVSGQGAKIVGPLDGLAPLCALVAAMDVVVSPDTAVGPHRRRLPQAPDLSVRVPRKRAGDLEAAQRAMRVSRTAIGEQRQRDRLGRVRVGDSDGPVRRGGVRREWGDRSVDAGGVR